jgi:hypothetical protein
VIKLKRNGENGVMESLLVTFERLFSVDGIECELGEGKHESSVTTEDGVGIESQKMLVPKGPKGVG